MGGHSLALRVCRVTRRYPADEKFALAPQNRRAAVSVTTNLAEGLSRESRGDFRSFVGYAAGSAAELDYLLRLALDLGYLDREAHDDLRRQLAATRRTLFALLRSLGERPRSRERPRNAPGAAAPAIKRPGTQARPAIPTRHPAAKPRPASVALRPASSGRAPRGACPRYTVSIGQLNPVHSSFFPASRQVPHNP